MASVKQIFAKMNATQKALLALVLILPAPLIGVSCSLYLPPIQYFVNQHTIDIGRIVWAVAKLWLVLLPVVWLLCIDKEKLSWSPTTKRGVLAGLLWSIPFALIIYSSFWLVRSEELAQSKEIIEELGLASPANFLIFASVMSLVNSLMEEYVWRWFVFSKFKILFGVWPAIILSSFFFTVHHVVILWSAGSLLLVIVGSVSIFVGGIIWAWLYNKYNSIWPGWICHVAADTAVMWVIWLIITS